MSPLSRHPQALQIERALAALPAGEVERVLAEAEALADGDHAKGALHFARGLFGYRSGSTEAAIAAFAAAEACFLRAGDSASAELSEMERAASVLRRAEREHVLEVRDRMIALSESASSDEGRVLAWVVRGTAERVLGEPARALESLSTAVARSDGSPKIRARALNSLGTLYVALGTYGAAVPLLEHAAELCRLQKDIVGEAIAMGQLGTAAMGLFDLSKAKRQLGRQEFLARSIGDAHGQARALTFLGDVALLLGRPDDAYDLGERAKAVASTIQSDVLAAYAERLIGRSKRELGRSGALAHLEKARAIFSSHRLPLGEALSAWDEANLRTPYDGALARFALEQLASLGLVDRVIDMTVEANEEHHAHTRSAVLLSAAIGTGRSEPLEASLALSAPQVLAATAARRGASKRNLAKLVALAVAPRPWIVFGTRVPPRVIETGDGVVLGQLFDISVVAFALGADGGLPGGIRRDLASWSTASEFAGSVTVAPEAELVSCGFGGALGAETRGVDGARLVREAVAAISGELRTFSIGEGALGSELSALIAEIGLRVVEC